PPRNGEDGSIESTATSRSAARRSLISEPISVDLPAPGGPVKPTTAALPVFGYTSRTSAQPSGSSSSTSEMPRASARLSPASRRSARVGFSSAIGRRRIRSAPMDTLLEPVRHAEVRGTPPPLSGGPLALLRFMRAHRMLTFGYARLIARWAWLKLRWRGRLGNHGPGFLGPRGPFGAGT